MLDDEEHFYIRSDFCFTRIQIRSSTILPIIPLWKPPIEPPPESSGMHVTECIEGPRLADCSSDVIRELCPIGVECFLAQLLDIGIFHSDPHPGNLLVSDNMLVLLDFGLVAEMNDFNLQHHATAPVVFSFRIKDA